MAITPLKLLMGIANGLPPLPRVSPRGSRVQRSRRRVLTCIAFVLLANLSLSIGLDTFASSLRDSEYAYRRNRAITRIQANPDRPVTVVLGSSRTDSGVRPLIADRGPLVCNVSQAGAGPLLELLTLQRLLHDGVVPGSVIVEYWPPQWRGDGSYSEHLRIDPHRYYASDERFIRSYHPHPAETLRLMREIRRTPVWNHRQRLMSHLLPAWLPLDRRLDFAQNVDAAGWLPGHVKVTPEQRAIYQEKMAVFLKPLLAEYRVAPVAERAMQELLAMCHQRGIAVTIVWMPESSALRSWYTPDASTRAEACLSKIKVMNDVRVVVAREWMPDDAFADGVHLTTDGAAAFTTRLMSVITP